MVAISFFSVPVGRFLYDRYFRRLRDVGVAFEKSFTYQVQVFLSEAARIGLVAYLFDIIEIWLQVPDISNMFTRLMFSTWIALG